MAKLKLLTQAQIELVKGLYPHTDTAWLAERLGLTKSQLIHLAHRNGVKKTAESRSKMAAALAKKSPGGFKSGYTPYNTKPIGSTRINSKGCLMVKVAEPRKWILMSQKVWEDNHGNIPKSHIIIHKDGDKLNCSPENLILMSKKDALAQNTVHNLPPEIKELIQMRGNILRCITNREKKESGK